MSRAGRPQRSVPADPNFAKKMPKATPARRAPSRKGRAGDRPPGSFPPVRLSADRSCA